MRCKHRRANKLTRVTSGFTHEADTVQTAAATPDQPQPFRELGLKDDEYQRIREILGRRPTDAELAMYSVMWSEHCSYKSSKVHLRYFGETTTEAMRASSTSATAGRPPSRSSRTTTRRTSSPTRARPPESVASSATSWRWVPARWPSWTSCGSAPPMRLTRAGWWMEWCAASAATETRWDCPTSAARPSSTRPTPATHW